MKSVNVFGPAVLVLGALAVSFGGLLVMYYWIFYEFHNLADYQGRMIGVIVGLVVATLGLVLAAFGLYLTVRFARNPEDQ